MNEEYIDHPLLGRLELHVNARAKRFSFRPTKDGLRVTTPKRYSKTQLLTCIEEMLPRLQQLKERHNSRQTISEITPDVRIDTEYFHLQLVEGEIRRPAARFINGTLTVTYPHGLNFQSEKLQKWLLKVAEESVRYLANRLLIKRFEILAARYGFLYQQVKIHKTHGRWGSCNSKKHINLSLYLTLLPPHLQDYVILHELCHTLEMNHGPRFWAKMDEVTNGQSATLRNEMKKFDTNIYCFCKNTTA